MGHDEQPSPAVASACFSRRKQARFWAIAQAAKAFRDLGKSQIEMSLDVFREDDGRFDLADDSLDIGPEVARIALTLPLSGKAEGLTRITGREDMNAAAPWSAVEGFEIVPYRRAIQGRVFHPRHESGRRMGFPLDVTDSSITGLCDGDAEIEAAIASAEGEAAQLTTAGGTNNHNAILRWLLDRRSEVGSQASIQ